MQKLGRCTLEGQTTWHLWRGTYNIKSENIPNHSSSLINEGVRINGKIPQKHEIDVCQYFAVNFFNSFGLIPFQYWAVWQGGEFIF